jgi:DNA topoisomerase-3
LESSVLSYGPCQTPTLGFCVQRHIDIEMFKPEAFWALDLCIYKQGRASRCVWEYGRSFVQNKVDQLERLCIDEKNEEECYAVVTNKAVREMKQGRPNPMNTVAFLKACSKGLGIGPHSGMLNPKRKQEIIEPTPFS